jgi:thiol-disulfide isomerase/thioredoxin
VLISRWIPLAVGLLVQVAPATGRRPLIGDPVPALDLPSLDGGARIDRERLIGHITVIEFFATWCAPCRQGLEDLRVLRAKLGPALETIVVACDDPAKVRMFLAAHPAPEAAVILDDNDRAAAHRWAIDRFPTTFFVDGTGTIRNINAGHGPGFRARAQRWLQRLLQPASGPR